MVLTFSKRFWFVLFFHLFPPCFGSFDDLVQHLGLLFAVTNSLHGPHLALPLATQTFGHFLTLFWKFKSFASFARFAQAVFIQVTERRPLKSLLPAVKTSCWKQLSCHPKQKYFRGGTSLPQNFGLDSSTLLIEKRVQVKIGLSHSKRLYYRYKEYFCSLSWRKSLGDISLFHNRSTFFQKPWRSTVLK